EALRFQATKIRRSPIGLWKVHQLGKWRVIGICWLEDSITRAGKLRLQRLSNFRRGGSDYRWKECRLIGILAGVGRIARNDLHVSSVCSAELSLGVRVVKRHAYRLLALDVPRVVPPLHFSRLQIRCQTSFRLKIRRIQIDPFPEVDHRRCVHDYRASIGPALR